MRFAANEQGSLPSRQPPLKRCKQPKRRAARPRSFCAMQNRHRRLGKPRFGPFRNVTRSGEVSVHSLVGGRIPRLERAAREAPQTSNARNHQRCRTSMTVTLRQPGTPDAGPRPISVAAAATFASGRSPSGSSQSPSSAQNSPTKTVESDIFIWAHRDFSNWCLHPRFA